MRATAKTSGAEGGHALHRSFGAASALRAADRRADLPPVVSIRGDSGSGKTCLIEQLLPVLTGRGLRVATIKHASHPVVLDTPGKDSARHAAAGAGTVVLVGPDRTGVFMNDTPDGGLASALEWTSSRAELVLTEGYRREAVPCVEIETWRGPFDLEERTEGEHVRWRLRRPVHEPGLVRFPAPLLERLAACIIARVLQDAEAVQGASTAPGGRSHRSARPVSASAADLALIGEIATILDPSDVADSIDIALDRLREGTGADASELFLADPEGRAMYLVCHRGEDAAAFEQRDHFARGEGFPGIVLRTGAAILTDALESHGEFLRSRVKTRGYRAAVCVPMSWDDTVGGCLFLAWRAPIRNLRRVVRLAGLAGRAVATAVQASHACLRVHLPPGGSIRGDAAAETLRKLGRADSVRIDLLEDEINAEHPGCSRTCPVVAGGHARVLGGRDGWPRPCLEAGCVAKARYCIPLLSASRVIGRVTLAFHDLMPTPRTRWLPTVLRLSRDLGELHLATDRPQTAAAIATGAAAPGEPRLEIRCFGGLEIRVEGRVLPATLLKRGKARELLALLAAVRRPATTEALSDQLWPGVPFARAKNRFHVTLSALRSAIEPGPGRRPWTHVLCGENGFHLDAKSGVAVDLWQYDELRRQARSAEAELRPLDEVAALLEDAVGLWTGEVFDGAFTSEWSDTVAARYRQDVLEALGRLSALWLQLGDTARAARALERARAIAS